MDSAPEGVLSRKSSLETVWKKTWHEHNQSNQ